MFDTGWYVLQDSSLFRRSLLVVGTQSHLRWLMIGTLALGVKPTAT